MTKKLYPVAGNSCVTNTEVSQNVCLDSFTVTLAQCEGHLNANYFAYVFFGRWY